MEKGIEFVPTRNMINETGMGGDFSEFSKKGRCKWYFRDQTSKDSSEIPAFRQRFSRKPSTGDPYVKIFLSKMEHEVFSFLPRKPQSCNLNKEEWQALKNLKEDRSIII